MYVKLAYDKTSIINEDMIMMMMMMMMMTCVDLQGCDSNAEVLGVLLSTGLL